MNPKSIKIVLISQTQVNSWIFHFNCFLNLFDQLCFGLKPMHLLYTISVLRGHIKMNK